MTQEPILFNDTIYNILWSNPQATEEDIWNALDFGKYKKEYVASLDLGIETYVEIEEPGFQEVKDKE
jgi:ABC-type multidrug transport system fused ATPase/permease subunit